MDLDLYEATTTNNYNVLKELLKGCNCHIKSGPCTVVDHEEVILWAAHRGHIDIVKRMIAAGACNLCYAIDNAVEGAHFEIVKTLLDVGHQGTYNDGTPRPLVLGSSNLFQSVKNRDYKMIELIMQYRNTKWFCEEAIEYSGENRDWDMIIRLLELGCLEFDIAMKQIIKSGNRDLVVKVFEFSEPNHSLTFNELEELIEYTSLIECVSSEYVNRNREIIEFLKQVQAEGSYLAWKQRQIDKKHARLIEDTFQHFIHHRGMVERFL